MKKVSLLIIALLCSLFVISSSAEASEMPPVQCTVDGPIQPMESTTTYTYIQNCVVHFQVMDAETEEILSVESPAVFTITYKVKVTKRLGMYTGGDMLVGRWPKLDLTNYSEYDLDVSVQRISYPVLSFQGGETSFSGTISGGLLTVTYNSLIKVHDDGTVTAHNPITQQRAFYLEFSGPNSNQ